MFITHVIVPVQHCHNLINTNPFVSNSTLNHQIKSIGRTPDTPVFLRESICSQICVVIMI